MKQRTWRTVRVFISSTFRDMQAERDHLVRLVFPRLREELLKRRIHLVDVDLRWGVTSEQDALEVCREIIDECRPRFLCVLGGRYGWVPPDKEHSITADEVRYSVLDRPDVKEYRYFYFRDPGATDSIPKEAAREHGYVEADSANAQKLADLKQTVRDAGFEPFIYDARWDPENQRLVGLEAFGNRVYADLLASVDDEFGAELPEALDEFAEEDAAMEAFIEERVERYVVGSRSTVFNDLTSFAQADGEPNIAVVTGPSGSGKSALLGKFSQDYARDNPDDLVITHFVGASAGSTDLRRTLRRLCHALAQAAGDEREIPQDVKELAPLSEELLGVAAQRGRVLLIVDALNQLDATDNAHTMYWLPRSLPTNVRAIVSSLEHPALEALRRRAESVKEIPLQPLIEDDERAIIDGFLARYRKQMSEEQIGGLISKRESGNPLYLLAALEELRTLGTYEKITQRIRELPDEVQPLFLWIMRRLEADPGFRDADGRPIGPELVRQFVSSLGLSRRGLSQTELAELIAPGDPPDEQGNIAALIRLLRPYLMHRGELLDFYHTQLQEAVEAEYLDEEHERLTAHRQLAEYFRRKADPTGDSTWTGNHPRGLSELPYHETLGRMWVEAYSTLVDFRWLEARSMQMQDGLRSVEAVYALQEDYRLALSHWPVTADHERERTTLDAFLLAIRREHIHWQTEPRVLFQQLYPHLWWGPEEVRHELRRLCQEYLPSYARTGPWIRRSNRPSAGHSLDLRLSAGEDAIVTCLQFWEDAGLLAAGTRYTGLCLWELSSGLRHSVSLERDSVRRLGIGPEDPAMLLVVCASGRVVACDRHTLDLRHLVSVAGNVMAADVSRDGRHVVVGTTYGITEIWDVRTRRRCAQIGDRRVPVTHVSFSGDGSSVLSVSSTGRCLVQDLATLEVRARVRTGRVIRMVVPAPPGDAWWVGTQNGGIAKWTSDSIATGGCFDLLPEPVCAGASSPCGRMLVIGGRSGVVAICRSDRTNLAPVGFRTEEGIDAVQISAGLDLVAVAAGGGKCEVHRASMVADSLGDLPAKAVTAPRSCGHEGQTVIAAADDSLRMVSAQDRAVSRPLLVGRPFGEPSAGALAAPIWVAVTPGGREEWSAWHVGTRARLGSMWCRPCSAIAISSAGDLLATGHRDGWVMIWDVLSGGEQDRQRLHQEALIAIAFTADGTRLLTLGAEGLLKASAIEKTQADSSQGRRSVYSLVTHALLQQVRLVTIWEVPVDPSPTAMVCARNDALVACAMSGSVRLFLPTSGEVVADLHEPHSNWVGLAFSHDASLLVGMGAHGACNLWDVKTRRTVAHGTLSAGALGGCWLPEGMQFALSTQDGDVHCLALEGWTF